MRWGVEELEYVKQSHMHEGEEVKDVRLLGDLWPQSIFEKCFLTSAYLGSVFLFRLLSASSFPLF